MTPSLGSLINSFIRQSRSSDLWPLTPGSIKMVEMVETPRDVPGDSDESTMLLFVMLLCVDRLYPSLMFFDGTRYYLNVWTSRLGRSIEANLVRGRQYTYVSISDMSMISVVVSMISRSSSLIYLVVQTSVFADIPLGFNLFTQFAAIRLMTPFHSWIDCVPAIAVCSSKWRWRSRRSWSVSTTVGTFTEVNARRPRLVLGWVTIKGAVNLGPFVGVDLNLWPIVYVANNVQTRT